MNYGQLLSEIQYSDVRVSFMTRSPGLRFLLGVFEAGMFPGVNYYLSWCVATIIYS